MCWINQRVQCQLSIKISCSRDFFFCLVLVTNKQTTSFCIQPPRREKLFYLILCTRWQITVCLVIACQSVSGGLLHITGPPTT
jgi:hypothetical protein